MYTYSVAQARHKDTAQATELLEKWTEGAWSGGPKVTSVRTIKACWCTRTSWWSWKAVPTLLPVTAWIWQKEALEREGNEQHELGKKPGNNVPVWLILWLWPLHSHSFLQATSRQKNPFTVLLICSLDLFRGRQDPKIPTLKCYYTFFFFL